MLVRAATEADADAVRRIAERSWESDCPEVVTRESVDEAVNDWYAPAELADELARDRTLVRVAERGGEVAGFAHATWTDDGEGYILRLYVDPDHRRENVGAELLRRVCDDLRDRGVEEVNAMVLADNDPGNEFYDRNGFDRVDEAETTIGEASFPEHRYVLADVDQLRAG